MECPQPLLMFLVYFLYCLSPTSPVITHIACIGPTGSEDGELKSQNCQKATVGPLIKQDPCVITTDESI